MNNSGFDVFVFYKDGSCGMRHLERQRDVDAFLYVYSSRMDIEDIDVVNCAERMD